MPLELYNLQPIMEKALGRKGYKSQSYLEFKYGYAFVQVYKDKVVYRKEGGEKKEAPIPVEPLETTVGTLVKLCEEVLATGRTIECGKGIGMKEWQWMPSYQTTHSSIEDVVEYMDGTFKGTREAPWNMNPDYQRDACWTDEQAERFVGYWLSGGQVPLIFLQRYSSYENSPVHEYWDLPIEVIDGQQRLRALYRWVKGEIAAEIADGRKFWFKDTNEIERRMFPAVVLAYVDLSRKDRLRFYLGLNRGGTVHTDAEIARVRDLLNREK